VSSVAEPTAVAAVALGDADSHAWLRRHQHRDGGFPTFSDTAEDASPAALAALALGVGESGSRALDYVLSRRARTIGESGVDPSDSRRGWGWTPDTFSWVEPTARVLLATRVLRPEDAAVMREAHGVLAERQCPDGGWNHGSVAKIGIDPRGYLQTTAVALQALRKDDALVPRALNFVDEHWRSERGGLSLAQTIIALRLHGRQTTELERALASSYRRTRFLDNILTLAWAALATAPATHLAALGGTHE
jgi:hypothetical protein